MYLSIVALMDVGIGIILACDWIIFFLAMSTCKARPFTMGNIMFQYHVLAYDTTSYLIYDICILESGLRTDMI